MSTLDMNATLCKLTARGLEHAESAYVVMFAKQLWYSNDVPDLGALPSKQRNDAGYVVDCLAMFNVLPKERKAVLLSLVKEFKPTKIQSFRNNVDPLANAWNASGDLMKFMPDLLPLQTRTYASELSVS